MAEHESECPRSINAEMERQVRRLAGFGCVVCGSPLVEYHHIEPWSVVKKHEVENLAALCPNHHAEATGLNPLLPEQEVRKRTRAPYNLSLPLTDPHPLHYGPHFRIRIAGQDFALDPPGRVGILAVDGQSLAEVVFEEDHMNLCLDLYDRLNRAVLVIDHNTVRVSPSAWDIQWVANRLRIRNGSRRMVFDARFSAQDNLLDIRQADFRFNGLRVRFSPGHIQRVRMPGSEGTECRQTGGNLIEASDFRGGQNLFRFDGNGGAVFTAGLSPMWSCVYLGDNLARTDGFSHPTTWGIPPPFAWGPALLENSSMKEQGSPDDIEGSEVEPDEGATS